MILLINLYQKGYNIFMKLYTKKSRAFSLSSALIAIVIMGVIGVIVIPQWQAFNPTRTGWDTLANKMSIYLNEATVNMLSLNSGTDDIEVLTDNGKSFKLSDANSTASLANLFTQYLSKINMNVDTSKEYFSQEILDYKKKPIGEKLKDSYSNFHFAADGILVGYRLYGSCKATEKNTNPPGEKEKYEVNNICGSVFFDVNAYKKPNKLGSDQYIIPIGIHGMKYNNELF